MTTFADLGIPFPLFEAPTSETSDYAGRFHLSVVPESEPSLFQIEHRICGNACLSRLRNRERPRCK